MDFNLDELMNEHTATALVEDAAKRPSIPVGVYTGSLKFKKAVKSELRQDGSGFDGRPEIWMTVSMQDDSDRKYSTTAFLSYVDWRYNWDEQATYKPGDPGHKAVRQDQATKLWGQLVGLFDKSGELSVKEQIETIAELPVKVGIKGKFENEAGETKWAYNAAKAQELTAQGYTQVGDGINFFGEVKG